MAGLDVRLVETALKKARQLFQNYLSLTDLDEGPTHLVSL